MFGRPAENGRHLGKCMVKRAHKQGLSTIKPRNTYSAAALGAAIYAPPLLRVPCNSQEIIRAEFHLSQTKRKILLAWSKSPPFFCVFFFFYLGVLISVYFKLGIIFRTRPSLKWSKVIYCIHGRIKGGTCALPSSLSTFPLWFIPGRCAQTFRKPKSRCYVL